MIKAPLVFKEHPGTGNLWFYPRDIMQAVANAADLTVGGGGDQCEPIMQGIPRVLITAGGNTVRTGTIIIFWEPL